ncbi:unnamed protein product, partial [Polarella glacialis]
DEFLLDGFRANPPSCRVYPVDPNEARAAELGPLPWKPGGQLPMIDRPLVSFHAYSVYGEEAQMNQQRWLQDPDVWNSYFIALVKDGFLKLCLNKEDCIGDQSPYRLMFWEDVSSEFVDCVARGITPIYAGTGSVHEYTERNVVLTPWRFETPAEMADMVSTLSSPQGVLEYGTKVYMQRQSNHILGNLYWNKDVRLRALLMASAARKQPKATSARGDASPIAELVVCVASAASKRSARDIIRQTWGKEDLVRTAWGPVQLKVVFFLGAAPEAAAEHAEMGDVVLLPNLEESFGSIWLKTAAILKFGADYFRSGGQGLGPGSTIGLSRFLVKCDDDAFIDIDAMVADLLVSPPVGLYWGHVMALVEPNRIEGDKYFVPYEVYPDGYYPPYARGMAYALSE